MRLYISLGPNPAVALAYATEQRLALDTVWLDLTTGENRRPAFLTLNPAGSLPVLELDNGATIAESIAICEFLDEAVAQKSLIGDSLEERATTRMWLRRVDFMFAQPSTLGWRYAEGVEWCRKTTHVIPHAADDLKLIARQGLAWIDAQMGDNDFVCGNRFSLADILLYTFVEFGQAANQPTDPSLAWVQSWRRRMAQRPFADALDPAAAQAGLA